MTVPAAPIEPTSYVFDRDRSEEERRLIAQSRLLDPITEPLLREAGLGPGMHVVDLGSGVGDSSILAAHIVGPTGSVLGLERAPEAAALARRRVAEASLDNVTFVEANITALDEILAEHPGPVDAVLGRWILLWVPERQAVLRACARWLRPGALVWFQEFDATYDFAEPSTPLWDRLHAWLQQTADGLGIEKRMGPKLHRAFRDAGLPWPQLRGCTLMWSAPVAPVWFWVNIFRGLLPAMEELGVATAEQLGLETLGDRLTAELRAAESAMIFVPNTAAWVRLPD